MAKRQCMDLLKIKQLRMELNMISLKLLFFGLIGFVFTAFIIDYFTVNFTLPFLLTKNSSHEITEHNEFVKYRHVQPKSAKKIKATIFIFPPTGGENIVDRLYARSLAVEGFEVFILQKWTGYEIKGYLYNLHNKFYGSAQKALNKVITKASTNIFGILGTSVGALHTSIALTTNGKMSAGFIIVGGLPIPDLIVKSSQQAMKDLKAKRYKAYNLKNDEQYIKELSDAFDLEPTKQQINLGKNINIGNIASQNDQLVPYENQKMVQAFFNTKPIYKSKLSHTSTVAWYGLFQRKLVIKFFNKHLN